MIRAVFVAAALVLTALPLRAAVEIQEVTSPGGLTAWLVQEPAIPFTALELQFKGGSSLDPTDKAGAVNLMMGLLEEGAGELDAQAFTVAVESLAAEFRFRAYKDSVEVSARFLTENRDEALSLLRLALNAPRFDADAVERVRAQVLANIDADAKDPEEISGAVFTAQAYPGHPYGVPLNGTAETVAALTRDDLVAAHAGVFARDRVYAAAVGDMDAETLGATLDYLLGDLPETGAPMPEVTAFADGPSLTVVDYPTPQSVVTFGHAGIARDDPDFFPAFVMMQVLGGSGFQSRLMEEVRVKRGLTYGIGAYLVTRDYANAVTGRVSTVNSRVAETVDVIRAEWRKMAEHGVSEEELTRVKTYLTGAYPLRFDGNARIAGILVGMQADGLTPDYIETRNDKVMAVTREDIARVAERLIRPDALRIVVVGEPEGLAPAN